jgi:PKD repeat protein
MQVGLGFNPEGDLLVQANVEVTEDISTTNNKIVYIVKWYQNEDYFCTVVGYDYEAFDLTSIGETGSYSHSFPMNAAWEIEDLHAVAMVQTYSGNKQILQAGQAQLTGLVAGLGSNLTSGPPSLGVHFQSLSYPITGIETWEWDIDGDGVYDYTDENPYHLYDTPGTYDVSLRIGMEGEYDEVTIPEYITVTEDAVVEGTVSGIWHAELGPYLATGDLLLKSGNTLVIEPGTQVMLENEAEFVIKGHFTADAREGEMIVFNSESSWQGLHFVDNMADNIVAWCDISGAADAAVYLENSSCGIYDNVIHDNTATDLGAAIELLDVMDITISGNLIANNTSTGLTCGISMINSYPNISNNIIVNNSANTAGAFSIKQNSAPVITNCTIAHNTGVNGAFLLFNSQPTIINSIIQSDGNVFAVIASTPTVLYTCLSGGYTGEGNIDEDPMFMVPSAGSGSGFDGMTADWQLADGSPCIDAGDPNPVYNDLDGTQNDMGAYGWNGFPEYNFTDSQPHQITPHVSSLKAYPNPFNPQTSISFDLADETQIILDVYNVKGEKLETIATGSRSAGTHNITWQANENASGVYFFRLQTDNQEIFTRAILLK